MDEAVKFKRRAPLAPLTMLKVYTPERYQMPKYQTKKQSFYNNAMQQSQNKISSRRTCTTSSTPAKSASQDAPPPEFEANRFHEYQS